MYIIYVIDILYILYRVLPASMPPETMLPTICPSLYTALHEDYDFVIFSQQRIHDLRARELPRRRLTATSGAEPTPVDGDDLGHNAGNSKSGQICFFYQKVIITNTDFAPEMH